MGDLRYRDPDTGLWESIPLEGPVGATGPPGPVGPPSGGVNVVGWAYDADITTGAANTLTLILSTTVHIKPDSFYELAVGWRCVSDFGAAGLLQYEVKLNDVAVPTHSVLSTNGDSGLDLAHYRAWIRKGDWAVDVEGDYTFQLMIMTSVANRIVYSPEISVVELNDPNAPVGGGGPIALDDLSDVAATGPTDGQVLTYDDAQSLWVPGTGGNHGRVEFTTTPSWYRIARFQGVGSAEFTLSQTGRSETSIRVFTLAWTGEHMQVSMQGLTGYGNHIPNFALHSTGLYGEQYLDVQMTGSAAGVVEATWSVSEEQADGPGSTFQPAAFELQATAIAAPAGTATPWPAVAGGSAPSYALDDLTDVAATGPTDGQVLTWDATALQWVPEAPAGGGGSDWVGPVTITTPTGDPDLRIDFTRQDYPDYPVSIIDWYNGLQFKTGNGTLAPTLAATIQSSSVGLYQYLSMKTSGEGIKFYAAGPDDTVLQPGATAGILTINDLPIQTTVIAADGTQVGIQQLLDRIAALEARIAALEAR